MDSQTLIQILSITGSLLGSALIAWKLPKYYIDKEAVEPLRELKETTRVQQKEIDMLKQDLNSIKINEAKNGQLLLSIKENLENLTEKVTDLAKSVFEIVKSK